MGQNLNQRLLLNHRLISKLFMLTCFHNIAINKGVLKLNKGVHLVFFIGPVFEKGQLRVYYGVSHRGVVRPKNICLFPICCHFNQWVGRKFILFYFLLVERLLYFFGECGSEWFSV